MYVDYLMSCKKPSSADATKVAVKYFEYYEKLSQMLERLAEHIVIFDLFTQNNSDEQILHRVRILGWIYLAENSKIG
jgi:hypothetical protein